MDEVARASSQGGSRGAGLAGKRCSGHCCKRTWARSKPSSLCVGTTVLSTTSVDHHHLECAPVGGPVGLARRALKRVGATLGAAWR